MPCPNCPLIKILEIVRKCFLTVFRPLFTNIEGTKAKKVVLQRIFMISNFELIYSIFDQRQQWGRDQPSLTSKQHNFSHRCLYSLQISIFLLNDFGSLIVRQPQQHKRHRTAIVDTNQADLNHANSQNRFTRGAQEAKISTTVAFPSIQLIILCKNPTRILQSGQILDFKQRHVFLAPLGAK